MDSKYLLDFAVGIAALYVLNNILRRPRLPLPPGPKPLPIIGNLMDMPTTYNWIHFAKYRELYGSISSLSLMGQTLIILNNHETCVELLDKRSLIYSDRPTLTFAMMCGLGNTTIMSQYGTVWASHRRNMYKFIGTKEALSKLYPVEEDESRRFVRRILNKSETLLESIRLLAGAVILKVAYGYAVDTEDTDPLILLADQAITLGGQAFQPGKWLVDVLPFLQYIPDWLPGSYCNRKAREYKHYIHKMANIPYEFVKKQMQNGTARPSFVASFIEENEDDSQEPVIKWAAMGLYAGGADTTVSIIYAFFIAMQLYPDVQSKAQAEIDAVLGADRMPSFADRPHLRYVDALVKELLRWHSVVPLGIPHVVKEDDCYQGYRIPKGSLVLINSWGITHDPEKYPDPHTFNPERFLSSESQKITMDPHDVVFGYGRRVCPGKDMASAAIFIAIATCIAAINIQKAKDAEGNIIEPKYEVTDNVTSHPKSFQCSITARSSKTQELLGSIADEPVNPRGDADAIRIFL